ncbi:MAG: isocitrate/isopropylmalate dehydrogenase family protein [Actinomycetes bacterium]
MTSSTREARRYRVALIRGDGIGPELTDSAVEVLCALADRYDLRLDFTAEPGGAGTYRETGHTMPPDALERLRTEYDAILKGPVGLPDVRHPDGTEAGLLGGVLRNGLDTYANVRPIRLLPGVRTPMRFGAGEIDYVIVRENTEGLYLSRGAGVANARAAADTLMLTREGCERVSRFAFALARRRSGAPADGVRRVTCVDKSNVLRSYAFFRRIFDEVAEAYPDIEADHRYADAAAHDLVADPAHFDVVVTENLLGDLLSDLGAATVGGLGMCPSGNMGDDAAYFEPIHGSAPTIAGQDRANPTSELLSCALMLEHLGEQDAAGRLRDAVTAAYAEGAVTLDGRGQPEAGTREVTRAVLDRL